MATGLRVDTSALLKRMNRIENIRADQFRAPLMEFTRRALNSCVELTPERSASLIRRNQKKQYRNRINYIPNYHVLEDPTLIVNEKDEHWLFSGGRWYSASYRHLPNRAQRDYEALLAERDRRLSTAESEFVTNRIQARSLYKKSWTQCGSSIGLTIKAPGRAIESVSRRQPPKAPPKGYAQVRGGGKVLSIVIFNPFLDKETAYWGGDGKLILEAAASMNRSKFDADTKKEFNQFLKDATRA